MAGRSATGTPSATEVERSVQPFAAAGQHHLPIWRHEDGRAQRFVRGELTKLALRGFQLAALGGALGAVLQFGRPRDLVVHELLFETALLRAVDDQVDRAPTIAE